MKHMQLKDLIRLLTNIYNADQVNEKRYNMLNDVLNKQLDLEIADNLTVYNMNPNPKDNPWEPIDEAETTGN
tara:strand:+ start:1592 stop:1807 length:216 start_codon:yes stop_codon:yes gene_type:complete